MTTLRLVAIFSVIPTVIDAATFSPPPNKPHHDPIISVRKSHSFPGGNSAAAGASSTNPGVLFALRGGAAGDEELAAAAWEWTSNLGAPAALVGGAVLATLAETRTEFAPKRTDEPWRRLVKIWCRFLLLSAFALEIVSIFVTTVTGTMLLSHGDRSAGTAAGVEYHSPMGFLHHNHEFEYLTSRITFLQGLFHWLAAVALDAAIPKEGEGVSAKRMNMFMASSLFTLILFMLAFYNHHMTFYDNYFEMVVKYMNVVMKRFLWRWPPRPMSFLMLPACIITCVLGYRAFNCPPDLDPVE